jgi:hypothetical protein
LSGGAIDQRGALEAVERVLNRGGDSDDVLRAVLGALYVRGVASARMSFPDGGGLFVGTEAKGLAVPIVFEDTEVGLLELAVEDRAFVERVATLISAYAARR